MTAVWMVKDGPYFSLLSARLSWLVDHLAIKRTTNQRLFGLERSREVTLTIGSLLVLGCTAAMVRSSKFQGDRFGFESQRSAVSLLATSGLSLRSPYP